MRTDMHTDTSPEDEAEPTVTVTLSPALWAIVTRQLREPNGVTLNGIADAIDAAGRPGQPT